MKIKNHGRVDIPQEMVEVAESIKYQNYKVNTPSKFQVNEFDGVFASHLFLERLQDILMINDICRLNYVYFSCSQGAEEHVDSLDPEEFTSTTLLIPIILPKGKSVITSEDEQAVVQLNTIYEFNHEKPHSMILEDTDSGCVVIMVAVRKDR